MLLLDTLKWDRFILLGHSGGGALSTIIAGYLEDLQRIIIQNISRTRFKVNIN